jgi:serpin B
MTCLVLALILSALLGPGVFAQSRGTSELVTGNTAFALDLYGVVRQGTDGNLLFSPYSISQAVAMTYAGARGETAGQIAKTLSFALPAPALNDAFHTLNADLVARGDSEGDAAHGEPARGLRIANALWGEHTYPFSTSYRAEIAQAYGAKLQQSDFVHAPEDARQQINAWVAEQTKDHIQNIVPEGGITPQTRLVLANAIYFNGPWQNLFLPRFTSDGTFYLRDGTTVTVPFMYQEVHLNYARGDGFQVIEFPYAGSDFSFTVIMPDEGRFDAFEEKLGPDALNAAISELAYTEVRVYLPKFKFDYGTDVAPALQSMGMTDAFDPGHADFSGMIEGAPPEPLFINAVLHQAHISVDENGTEATAATVIGITGAAAPSETEPPEVRIDRPFIFAIRDTETGTVLFLGRVMNPK